jgi:hypothetical protein
VNRSATVVLETDPDPTGGEPPADIVKEPLLTPSSKSVALVVPVLVQYRVAPFATPIVLIVKVTVLLEVSLILVGLAETAYEFKVVAELLDPLLSLLPNVLVA